MSLLILGAGYVGKKLAARHPEAAFTNRSGRDGALPFDLADETTWGSLPQADHVVWTFPAAPPDAALRLYETHLSHANVIVLGSTSAYRAPHADALVDETSPLDLSQPRVAGEEALRRAGACVLALAGIWGPDRDPTRWLRQGLVRNGRRYVNLAHVDDILAAIEALLRSPRAGARVNVSDGAPRRWSEHAAILRRTGRLPADCAIPESDDLGDSKRVDGRAVRELLGRHRFTRLT